MFVVRIWSFRISTLELLNDKQIIITQLLSTIQVSIIILRFECLRRCAFASARMLLVTRARSSATLSRTASGILLVYGLRNFQSLHTSTPPVGLVVVVDDDVDVFAVSAATCSPLPTVHLERVGWKGVKSGRSFEAFGCCLLALLGAAPMFSRSLSRSC